MPELPEVETITQGLRRSGLEKRAVTGAHLFWPKTLAGAKFEDFKKQIINQKILKVERRGKFITLAFTDNYFLLIHLRMTGRLSIVPKNAERGGHEHICLELDGKEELRFHDTRKFGRWYWTKDPDKYLGNLGPEPLEEGFTVDELAKMIKKKARQIKPLLLDQSFIAGLGNIYVDEALWEAKIHPQTSSQKISKKQLEALVMAIKHVLKRGIETQGTSLGKGKGNYYLPDGQSGEHQHRLSVFRRTGKPCPRCGTTIERIVVAQRSTHFCPHCQTLI